jgi:hypothetical protein
MHYSKIFAFIPALAGSYPSFWKRISLFVILKYTSFQVSLKYWWSFVEYKLFMISQYFSHSSWKTSILCSLKKLTRALYFNRIDSWYIWKFVFGFLRLFILANKNLYALLQILCLSFSTSGLIESRLLECFPIAEGGFYT